MIFNTKTHMVIIDTMDKSEASSFVKFLKSEIIRHGDDIKQAYDLIKVVEEKFNL